MVGVVGVVGGGGGGGGMSGRASSAVRRDQSGECHNAAHCICIQNAFRLKRVRHVIVSAVNYIFNACLFFSDQTKGGRNGHVEATLHVRPHEGGSRRSSQERRSQTFGARQEYGRNAVREVRQLYDFYCFYINYPLTTVSE